MKKNIYLLAFFLSVALVAQTWAGGNRDDKKIIWLKSNYPPYYITQGPNANKGIADRVEQLLREELVDYEHDSLVANWRRILHEMKSGKNVVCLTFLKTPEREKFIEYSILTSVKPTNGILVRADDFRFKNSTEISFKDLLNRKDIKVGIMHGRAYGKGIDRLLKDKKDSENIVVRTSADGVEGLIKLLTLKRLDAIVCYPHEGIIIAREHGIEDRIKFLKVVEQEPLNFSYTGAPKTEWGRKIIKEINRIYRKHDILRKTSIELEPYLDGNTVKWFRREVERLIEEKRTE